MAERPATLETRLLGCLHDVAPVRGDVAPGLRQIGRIPGHVAREHDDRARAEVEALGQRLATRVRAGHVGDDDRLVTEHPGGRRLEPLDHDVARGPARLEQHVEARRPAPGIGQVQPPHGHEVRFPTELEGGARHEAQLPAQGADLQADGWRGAAGAQPEEAEDTGLGPHLRDVVERNPEGERGLERDHGRGVERERIGLRARQVRQRALGLVRVEPRAHGGRIASGHDRRRNDGGQGQRQQRAAD